MKKAVVGITLGLLFCGAVFSWAKYESGSRDAASSVMYGNTGSAITPVAVDASGKIQLNMTAMSSDITTTGNVTAAYYNGNGSLLTGLTGLSAGFTNGTDISPANVTASGSGSFTNLTTNGTGASTINQGLNLIGAGTGTGINLRVQDVNGTVKVVVLDNGNVGIGNTNPTSRLDVVNEGQYIFKVSDGNDIFAIENTTGNNVPVITGMSSLRMAATILPNGNGTTQGLGVNTFYWKDIWVREINTKGFIGSVGIGTTAPDAKLQVAGTVNATGMNIGANAVLDAASAVGGDASGTLGNIQLGASSVGATELASTTVTAATYGNATYYPVVTVDADGRLTTVTNQAAPTQQWEAITGGLRTSGNLTVNGSMTIGNGTSSLWQFGSARFGIGDTTGTERLSILQTSGNVGIGTTNPNAALQVAGTVNMTGAFINTSAVLHATSAAGGDMSGPMSNLQIVSGAVGATELAATTVAAGVYGSASLSPIVTVDADGRITNVTNASITGTGGASTQWNTTGTTVYLNTSFDQLSIGTSSTGDNETMIIDDETLPYIRFQCEVGEGGITFYNETTWIGTVKNYYISDTECAIKLETDSGLVALNPVSTRPTAAVEGTLYANSTDHKLYYYNGTAWRAVF